MQLLLRITAVFMEYFLMYQLERDFHILFYYKHVTSRFDFPKFFIYALHICKYRSYVLRNIIKIKKMKYS